MQINIDGTVCLVATTQAEPGAGVAFRNARTGQLTGLAADATREIELTGGFFSEIAGDSNFSGTAEMHNGSHTALVFLSVI